MTLSSSHIFECAFDDELFAQLPHEIVREFDARSMIFHLMSKDGQHKIAADSGYWPQKQLESYSKHFVEKDILLQSRSRPENLNRIWNVIGDLVSPETLRNSEIYNDHYREHNDDLAYAIGGCFETPRGRMAIGIHRGKNDRPFSLEQIKLLGNLSNGMINMLMTRAEFEKVKIENNVLNQIIDNFQPSFLFCDENAKIINSDRNGGISILDEFEIRASHGVLTTNSKSGRALLGAISAVTLNNNAAPFYVKSAKETDFGVKILPIPLNNGRAKTLILKGAPTSSDKEVIEILRSNFNLSHSEANVAIIVAEGKKISEVAQERGVSFNTIKSQLNSIYFKTGCKKQSMLTKLIAGLKGY